MSTNEPEPSFQRLGECFSAADDQFLDEWVRTQSSKTVNSILERWVADERPWAQQQIVRYLQRDLNFAGHETVIKRLFRHYAAAGDHAMMARLMVALDRLVRRSRLVDLPGNSDAGEPAVTVRLFAKPNKTVVEQTGRTRVTGAGKWKRTLRLPDIRNRTKNRLFGHRTRNYLRRRVWRYFRWLSYHEPHAYLTAISSALIQYRDSDFERDENILDNWSLMHACYFHSETIQFTVAHTNLAAGRSLAQLNAAPWQPALWQSSKSAELLLKILCEAESSLVRVWAMELLQENHPAVIAQFEMSRLIQTPFDDVHRRSRTRLKAIAQIESALLSSPEQATTHLPLLAASVRSHRAPERRRALSAVATLMVGGDPILRAFIQELLPEISFGELNV